MEHITSYMAPTPLQQVSSTGKKLIGCGDSSSQKHIVDKVSFDPLISLIDVATVITPFLPPRFSRVSARKTRQPEPSRPDPTRARHIK
jgi:hypothetical protein